MSDARRLSIAEPARTPRLDLVLGWAATLPLVAAAVAPWALGEAGGAIRAAIAYGAPLLAFLGGVRRGLSFRTEGGPTRGQVAMALTLFGLALVGLFAALSGAPGAGLLALTTGFALCLALDPPAARRGEAPPYFARLRPPQMSVAVAALGALVPFAL
ncbi:MAG: DUF3429 domain-containing protein [Paracoccaceae bacterium]